jgi:hypothetical protein
MTKVIIEALTQAAADVGNIETALEEANAVAVPPTTSVLAPGADEVSAAITALFNTHGQLYQSLAAQAQLFHRQFATLLSQAGEAYQEAETAAQNTLRADFDAAAVETYEALVGTPTPIDPAPPIPSNVNPVALIVGGSGDPVVAPALVQEITSLYAPNATGFAVFTPEQFWPFGPGLGNETFDQSVVAGQADLNTVIMSQLALGHTATVYGVSQGASVLTGEIRYLMANGSPGVGQLQFVLAGDPNAPNGGILTRFAGYYQPLLDVYFNGATPPNSPYQTSIYINQYDSATDFPQYPLNVVSDVNAILGTFVGQHSYSEPGVGPYIQLPTSPGYTGNTTYYFDLDQTLPLVQPIRDFVPAPYSTALADLLQPDLRVISDLGYGQDEYANIPTPATVIEHPDWPVVGHDLIIGAQQGVDAAGVDLGLLPQSDYPFAYPFTPELNPGLNYPAPQVTGLPQLSALEGRALLALFGPPAGELPL